MKTVETLNEGLKREYRVTITAKDIDCLLYTSPSPRDS